MGKFFYGKVGRIEKKTNFADYTTNNEKRFTMRKKALLTLAASLAAASLPAQNVARTDSTETHKMEEVIVTQRRQLIKNDIDKLTYDVQHDKTARHTLACQYHS